MFFQMCCLRWLISVVRSIARCKLQRTAFHQEFDYILNQSNTCQTKLMKTLRESKAITKELQITLDASAFCYLWLQYDMVMFKVTQAEQIMYATLRVVANQSEQLNAHRQKNVFYWETGKTCQGEECQAKEAFTYYREEAQWKHQLVLEKHQSYMCAPYQRA